MVRDPLPNYNELIDMYNALYDQNEVPYAPECRRTKHYARWIHCNLPPGARILDVGCGRGDILKALLGMGYEAEGTEVASCLLEPGGDLEGLPVRIESVLDLDDEAIYDAVICSDVLEHLLTVDDVKDAYARLCRASKKCVLISAGFKQSSHRFNGKKHRLHFVIEDIYWWMSLFEAICKTKWVGVRKHSILIFGEKKCDM